MSDPKLVRAIKKAVTIPVMAKVRIGHFVEAQILEALEIDFIDESEVLTPADDSHHINKWNFSIPFVCGATNLGEALRRINEGAAMLRTKGEAGTGNVVEAVRHIRTIADELAALRKASPERLARVARDMRVPLRLLRESIRLGRVPVVNFAAGGIATPADAALVMQLGVDGVFVGSGIFKSSNPPKMAKAIVDAVAHYNDSKLLAEVSAGIGDAMPGLEIDKLDVKMQKRGW